MVYKKGLVFGMGMVVTMAILLAIPGSVSASDSPTIAATDNTISVKGTGSVYAVPDIAKFSTGVVTEADASADAMQKNAQLMDAVVGAIRSSGIPDSDIRTGQISLGPVYNNTRYKGAGNKPEIVGYKATNTVKVTIRDLSMVSKIVDAATNAGANTVNGVSLELSEDKAAEIHKQALAKAINNGAEEAKTIGDAAGMGSLKLKSVVESGTSYPRVQVSMSHAAATGNTATGAASPVSPGEQKVQATVTMVYTFV